MGILDFLDNSYDHPSDTRLKIEMQLGSYFLRYVRQTHVYTIAHSSKEEKIQALQIALAEFASKYVETRRTLREEITSLEENLAEFKGHAMTIGHDIDDEEFDGTCNYEARVRNAEPA